MKSLGEWIPASEQLPNDNRDVLVIYLPTTIEYRTKKETINYNEKHVSTGRYWNKHHWIIDNLDLDYLDEYSGVVTHWMYIPELPME